MKIQIIGGSGFIGSNLLGKLTEHESVNIDKIASVKSGVQTLIADVRDISALEKTLQSSDWLVLLAAEHRDDVSPVSLYYDVNVQGTKNVLEVLDKKSVNKVIFTSSVAVYGLNKNNPDEQYPVDPFNHYGKSKYEAEEVLKEWFEKDPENRTLIIIRPTVVFGPNNRGNVYNLLRQIASGKFLMIGSGDNIKSMAYVENITGFIKYCINQNRSGYHLYNYADKPDLTTNQLVNDAQKSLESKRSTIRIPYFIGYMIGLMFDVLAKVLNTKLPVSSVRVKKFCATTQFDASKVIASGYKPEYSLAEGIDVTIKSIKDNKS